MNQMLCSRILNWHLNSLLDHFFYLDHISNSISWSCRVSKNWEYLIVNLNSHAWILNLNFLKLLSVNLAGERELLLDFCVTPLLINSLLTLCKLGSQSTVSWKSHDPALNNALRIKFWTLFWWSVFELSD